MRQIGKAYSDLSHSMMAFRFSMIIRRYDHIDEARTAVYMYVIVPEYKKEKYMCIFCESRIFTLNRIFYILSL